MQAKSNPIIRPVTIHDAIQLQANCLSAMTLEQVQAVITNTLAVTQTGKELQIVAEVDGAVIGCATLIRDNHPLRSHRADLFGMVVHPDYQQ